MSSKEWAMFIACAVTCGFCQGSGIGFTVVLSLLSLHQLTFHFQIGPQYLLDINIRYKGLMCSSKKYPYSRTEGFLFCTLPPPGNSSLVSYIACKILTFKTPSS